MQTVMTNYIPEGDLYRLIVRSNLPAARAFERWLFDDALPSIRSNGAYIAPAVLDKVLEQPDTFDSLMRALERELRIRKA
jgi:prophage antirepressor-like protein